MAVLYTLKPICYLGFALMLKDVLEILRAYDRYLIVAHARPDGDAIGSQLALGLVLRQMGKQVTMLNSDRVPYSLSWLPGSQDIAKFNGSGKHVYAVAHAEVIVVVDTNVMGRLGPPMQRAVARSSAKRVVIDHHTYPESKFDVMYVREKTAATGQLIYEIICALDKSLITPDVATALYTALMTDTGSFRYATVTGEVHRVAADLLDKGSLPPAEVYDHVSQSRVRAWPRLVSKVLSTLTLLYDGKLAYMQLLQRMFRETNTHYDDAEGMIDWAMAVDGVRVAIMLTESRRGIKVSLRSKGDISVDEWARTLGGGGHPNAAGIFFRLSMEDAVDRVLAPAAKYLGQPEISTEVLISQEDEAYLSALTSSQR